MFDAALVELFLEVAEELRAVVGEDELRRLRQELAEGIEGDGEAAAGVNESEQVATQAGLQAHHGVAAKTASGGCLVPLGWRGGLVLPVR